MHNIPLNFKRISTAFVYAWMGLIPSITPAHTSKDMIEDATKSHASPKGMQLSPVDSDRDASVKSFSTLLLTIDVETFDQAVERDIKIGAMGMAELEDAGEFLFAAGAQLAHDKNYTASIKSKFQDMFSVLLKHYFSLSSEQENMILSD